MGIHILIIILLFTKKQEKDIVIYLIRLELQEMQNVKLKLRKELMKNMKEKKKHWR